MLYACKCTNVVVRTAPGRVPPEPTDDATPQEFFDECLGPIAIADLEVTVKHKVLCQTDTQHGWAFRTCLVCGQRVYAEHPGQGQALVVKRLASSHDSVESLRMDEQYSETFQVIIPRLSEFREKATGTANPQLAALLADRLCRETKRVEENIQRYSAEQFEGLRAFRERAEREVLVLTALARDTAAGDRPNSFNPLTPPLTPDSDLGHSQAMLGSYDQPRHQLKRPSLDKYTDICVDEVEQELFDGIDYFPGNADETGTMALEDDLNDDDDDEEEEEQRNRDPRRMSDSVGHIAHSLPIPTPMMPRHSGHSQADEQDDSKVDIAASIKALAKSVHNTDLWDLPRPRLSTQN